MPVSCRTSMPRAGGKSQCPVQGCTARFAKWREMQVHFHFCHPLDSIHILEEGSAPLPRCKHCGLQTTYWDLNRTHYSSALCAAGRERRRRAQALEDSRRAKEQVFSARGVPLTRVSTFKYLGRILSEDNTDWPAVLKNVKKARAKWAMVRKVLVRDQASPRVSGYFYKAVVQSVLLYGSETWVLTAPVLKQLEAFHHGVARQITGHRARFCRATSEWSAIPIADVLNQAGLLPIRDYVKKRQRKAAEYIATKQIYHEATTATRRSGSATNRKFWWMALDEQEE